MKQKELVAFYVVKIHTIVLNAQKKCVLNVTKWVIKLESVKKLKQYNVVNVIQLVTKKIDV